MEFFLKNSTSATLGLNFLDILNGGRNSTAFSLSSLPEIFIFHIVHIEDINQ